MHKEKTIIAYSHKGYSVVIARGMGEKQVSLIIISISGLPPLENGSKINSRKFRLRLETGQTFVLLPALEAGRPPISWVLL